VIKKYAIWKELLIAVEQADGAAEESLPDDYAWFRGGLYHRGGDVLLPFLAGNWAWLEDCEEVDAPKRAIEWQSQK